MTIEMLREEYLHQCRW